MKAKNVDLYRSNCCTFNFSSLFVLSKFLHEDLYVDEGYYVNLYIFRLYIFATERLAYDATPRRETHCRTRSYSNRVKYYSF
jgi:hypothetical protein